LATESPNNFRLLRHDYDIVSASNNAGYLEIEVAPGDYDGQTGNAVTVYNRTLDAMYAGEVQAGSDATNIITDIPFITGFDPGDTLLNSERDFAYFNDTTLHGGYYFEGRLTINGVLNDLTIIASPDSFGYADLDVSGILRIVTSLGKVTTYTDLIEADTNKSGNFTLEYRDAWFGSNNAWEPSEGSPSPLWYYAEAVRSEEQGSNLYEFVADDDNDAPFFNSFERPVYFAGLPFDLSFILPERALLSPTGDITVILRSYNANNTLLTTQATTFTAGDLEGHVCSLNIAPTAIPDDASYFTAEITAP
jgi:hypothetical protein